MGSGQVAKLESARRWRIKNGYKLEVTEERRMKYNEKSRLRHAYIANRIKEYYENNEEIDRVALFSRIKELVTEMEQRNL
jgi:hypothetical protein